MKMLSPIAALLCLAMAQQASAAAKASDVDPARDRIGQIVYPLGVHAPKETGQPGIAAHDKPAKRHARTPAPATDENGAQ